jgi:hypothetical protein
MLQSPEELMKLDNNTLLATWVELGKQQKHLKLLEMCARTLCVDRFFNSEMKKGKEELNVGSGYTLIATKKLTYKLNSKDRALVEETIEALKTMSEEGRQLAEKLFKLTYSLDSEVYNELNDVYKNMLKSIVTIDDATPTLTLKEPKVAKV